jgi:two-component system nitrate/nitrite sensor histidine kinase NarX
MVADKFGLSPVVEIEALRILQEALTNVYKHAYAHHVVVRLQNQSDFIEMSIHDDGQGFDLQSVDENGSHYGLRIMQERAERVGGRFKIQTAPGFGTHIRVSLPTEQVTTVVPAGGANNGRSHIV